MTTHEILEGKRVVRERGARRLDQLYPAATISRLKEGLTRIAEAEVVPVDKTEVAPTGIQAPTRLIRDAGLMLLLESHRLLCRARGLVFL